MHPSCQTLGVVITASKQKCHAAEVFPCLHGSGCFFAKEPLAKARGAVCRLPSRCRIGLGSGTLPLVKQMHSNALAVRESISSPSVELVITGGVSKQVKTKTSIVLSVSGGAVAGKMAAPQTTTPNPSIEGMPKRLRLLVTPHVKR